MDQDHREDSPFDMVMVAWAVVICALRVAGYKSEFYQGIAHIFVGTVLGYSIATMRSWYWWMFGAMTAVETVMATITFFLKR